MRSREPIVLIATGNADSFPSISGFSKSSALPPSGDFISRSAHSAMSNSVSTGSAMRFSSPARPSASMNCPNERWAICPRRYFDSLCAGKRSEFRRSGMSLENLERDDPAIREGDGLVRHRDARRYVGIKERIEEWIADKHKGAVMEMVHAVGTDESKSYTNPAVNSRAGRITSG